MKITAFTLAEVLMCLMLISVISAIMMTSIKVSPNSSMMMLRKAYSAVSQTVSDLINRTEYYPDDSTGLSASNTDDDITNDNTIKTFGLEPKGNGYSYAGKSKFCSLFANYVNITNAVDCSKEITLDEGGNFQSNDGIIWSMPITTFTTDNNVIEIDVNGDSRPNSCTDIYPDRFAFTVHANGRIFVSGCGTTDAEKSANKEKALDYLQQSKKINKQQ